MATRLSHRDLDACSRALRELYADPSLAGLAEKTLAIVSGLVCSDVISYDDWKLDDSGRVTGYRALRRPFVSEVDKFSPVFAACIHEHPLFREAMMKHAPEPTKISDFASRNQFRRTSVYNEIYRHLEIDSQIICTISWTPNSRNYVVLNRSGKDFSERDRNVLAFLKPHIAQALRNVAMADTMAFQLNVLGEWLDSMRQSVILAGADGQIHWQSALAREWLLEFFPGEYAAKRLPGSLANWLRGVKQSSPPGRPVFSELQAAARKDCRLVIYCSQSNSGEYVLALVRERMQIDLAAAQSFGLTPREAEILFWISEAKTRPEIGAILGISWRTIGKHMEHLFEKLGVENRHEAQRLGLELRRI